jgi:hypothetical protein
MSDKTAADVLNMSGAALFATAPPGDTRVITD